LTVRSKVEYLVLVNVAYIFFLVTGFLLFYRKFGIPGYAYAEYATINSYVLLYFFVKNKIEDKIRRSYFLTSAIFIFVSSSLYFIHGQAFYVAIILITLLAIVNSEKILQGLSEIKTGAI